MAFAKGTGLEPSVRRERVLGFLLCVIGTSLAVGMAAVAWQTAPTFLHPGELIDGDRFTGSSMQGRLALALIVSVSFTGLVFAGIGAKQALEGRRDKRLRWLGAFAMAITALLAWQTRSLL